MERSHYQARCAYFKNSQHGGGKVRSNALQEMFNWFYREITGSKARRRGNLSVRRHIMKVVSERRRQGYNRSNARERAQAWRATRRRVGRTWVPIA